jgi:hypothetical protein
MVASPILGVLLPLPQPMTRNPMITMTTGIVAGCWRRGSPSRPSPSARSDPAAPPGGASRGGGSRARRLRPRPASSP